MTIISITNLRGKIRKLADLVAFGGERIKVQRNGETAFVMVCEEEDALLEALESKADLKAVKAAGKALKKRRSVSLGRLKKSLKL